MYKLLTIILGVATAYLAYDRHQAQSLTGGLSGESSLGTLRALNEHLLAKQFQRTGDETNRMIPEFGIPMRVVTYTDTVVPKKGDIRDQVILVLDFFGDVRGIGGLFVPRVAIPPFTGKTEKLLRHFWTFVDSNIPDNEMDSFLTGALTDSRGAHTITVSGNYLHASWTRERERDRMFVMTALTGPEQELKDRLATETVLIDQESDAVSDQQVSKYKALAVERRLLAKEFQQLKKKRGTESDPGRRDKIESRMRDIQSEAEQLKRKMDELESGFSPDVLESLKS